MFIDLHTVSYTHLDVYKRQEVDWSWVGEFYAADWLEPLEVSDEVKADMPTLETFTKDGKVLAIPYANDYRLSYYNTCLLYTSRCV